LKAIHYAEVSETFAESRSPQPPLKRLPCTHKSLVFCLTLLSPLNPPILGGWGGKTRLTGRLCVAVAYQGGIGLPLFL
jgi:hypothetical protein